jgi:hypothetical protein
MGYTLSKVESFLTEDEENSDSQTFTENHPNLFLNPQFTHYHYNKSLIDKLIQDIADKMLPKLPIEEYFEAKRNSDMLFSNPEFIDAANPEKLITINDFKRLKPDFINKWYENFEFQNFQYLNAVFTQWKETKRDFKFNIEGEIIKCKRALEEFHSEIQSNESLKHNLFNIKILFNNLNFIKLENLEDSLQWAKIISSDVKNIIDKNFDLIFLLRNDIFLIYKKIEKLLEVENLAEEKILTLMKILFYISDGFQNLHGFLIIVRTLQKNKILEKKFYEELSIQRIMNKRREFYCYMNKKEVRLFGNEFEFEFQGFEGLKKENRKEDFYFFYPSKNSTGCLYDNNIYLFNKKSGLLKFYFSENENFICVNKNTNFISQENNLINDGNENYFSLVSLSNNLILINNNLFKKPNSKFKIFDKDTLTEKNIKITFDEVANKIFNTEEILPLQVPKYYRNSSKLNSTINDSDLEKILPAHLSVNFKNNYLYLTYPVLKIDDQDPDKEFYFSKNYIYTCDIFMLSQQDQENSLQINYSKSVILKSIDKDSSTLDEIFESTIENKFNNKFCILNGLLISFDESLKYDLISESQLVGSSTKFIAGVDTNESLFVCNQGMNDSILFLKFYEYSVEELEELKKISIIDVAGNISLYSEHNNDLVYFDYLKELKKFNQNEKSEDIDIIDGKIKKSENKKDVFIEFFNTEDEEEISQINSMKDENNFNNIYSEYLMFNLAILSNLKTKNSLNKLTSITEKSKFPFLINLEYPSMRLLHDIILSDIQSLDGLQENLHNIYSSLILLKNHLYQVESMNFDLKLIFKNEEEIIKLIRTLMRIFDKLSLNIKKPEDFKNKLEKDVLNLSIKIVFQIFSISYLKDEVIQSLLNEILNYSFQELDKQIDFVKNMILNEFLSFLSKNNNFLILLKNSNFNSLYLETILKYYLSKEKDNCKKQSIEVIEDSNNLFSKSKLNFDNISTKNSNLEKIFNSLYVSCYEKYHSPYDTSDQVNKQIYSSTLDRINQIIFSYSKDLLLKLTSLKQEDLDKYFKREIITFISSKSLTFKLLFFIISYCNIIDLDNQFVLKNWSYIVEIVKLISSLKESPELEENLLPSQKLDIIIDNNQFEDLSSEKKIFHLKLNDCKEKKNYQNLYVQFYVLAPSNLEEVKEIATINSPDGQKVLHVLKTHLFSKLDGPISKTQNSILENIEMSSGIQIKLNTLNKAEEKNKIFYKIRISNYKFFDNPIDFYLNPCIYLMNKILKKINFYENLEMKSLSISKELIELYNTRLFSSGIHESESENCKNDDNNLKQDSRRNDVEEFRENLTISSNYYFEKFADIFSNKENSNPIKREKFEEKINYKNFRDLINTHENNFTPIFKVFDKLLRIIQKESIHFHSHVFSGEIPDTLVKAIFFTIIKHENLFNILESQTENVEILFSSNHSMSPLINNLESPSNKSEEINYLHLLNDEQFEILFSIYRECSDIRKYYKAKKDEILKDEKNKLEDIAKYFEEIFKKLEFIFNLKVHHHHNSNSKSNEQYMNKSLSFERENSNNLSLKRSISKNEIEKKKSHSFNLNHRVKSLILTLLHVVKSDNISLENMKGGYEYMNLKAKFREIYLKIIQDLLYNINNTEIKANIITNFYNNFKSENYIPNIFDHNSSSSITNININSTFHEILSFILYEINQTNNSYFYTSILLNTLIWKIKGRDFDFLIKEKFFSIFKDKNTNEIIKNANSLLFIIPESNHKENNISKRFSNFSEFRPIDICHISKLLTEIFIIYSNLILKKIVKDMNKQGSEIGLVRTLSNLNEDYVDLLLNIFEVYEIQFSRLSKYDVNAEDTNTNKKMEINYTFPVQGEDDIKKYENFYFQQKLYNTLTSFYKVIINQNDKIKFVFKNYNLFSYILLTAFNSKCSEKNLRMIFQILKLFFKYNEYEVDIKLFTNVLKENAILFISYKDEENLMKYIFNVLNLINSTKKEKNKIDENLNKNLILDLILYIYNNIPIWSSFINDYIISNFINFIDKDSFINPIDLLGSNLSYLSLSNKVLSNSKLNLQDKKINFQPEEKDLNILIKEGYFVDTHKSVESQLKPKQKKNSRDDSDSDSERDHEQSKEEYIEVEKISNVILLKDANNFEENIKMNTADYLLSTNNDLLILEDFNSPVNDRIISLLINYLEKKIIEEKEYNLKLLIDYIKIFKYFNKLISSCNSDEVCLRESKNKIFEFVTKNFKFFEKLKSQQEFRFSLISMQNLESWLLSVVNLENNLINIDEVKRFELQGETCNINTVQDQLSKEKNSKMVLGKIDFTHKKINLFQNSLLGSNMLFPFLDYLILYSSLNSEYINNLETRIFEVDVLSSKNGMKNQNKKNEGKMVILTDEFINELEIIQDAIEAGESDSEESDDENENQEEDLNHSASADLSEEKNSEKDYETEEVDTKPEKKELLLKKQLSKGDIKNEHYKEKRLENFYKFIQKNFNLENCVFILNNKFFNKFKKNMICIGYDSYIVDFSSIKNKEDLISMINGSNKTEIPKENKADYFKHLFGDTSKSYSHSSSLKKIKTKDSINLQASGASFSEKEETMSKVNAIQQISTFDPFEVLLKKYDLKDITRHSKNNKKEKDEDKHNKDTTKVEVIEIKHTSSLKPKKLFREIFSTFPMKNTYRDSYDLISGVGIFIMQQNLRILKIKLEDGKNYYTNEEKLDMDYIMIEINNLKLLFYQEYFVKTYFNHKNNYEVIINHLKILLKYLIKKYSNEEQQENLKLVISNLISSSSDIIDYGDNPFSIEKIKSSSQDNFIKLIFELVNNCYDEEEEVYHKYIDNFIFILFKSLTEISENLIRKSSLENLLNAFDIIKFVINKISQRKSNLNISDKNNGCAFEGSLMFKIISYLDASCLFNSLLKFLLDKKIKEKSEFYIYSLELYLLFTTIFHSNNKFSYTLPDSIFLKPEIIEVHKNVDLIEHKLNSKYAKDILAQETEEFIKKRNLEIDLPVSPSYSIVVNSSLSEKLKLKISSNNLQNFMQENILCVQPILDSNQISNEYEYKKSDYKIFSNKFILNLDKSTNIKSLAYSNADPKNLYNITSSIRRIKISNKEKNIRKMVGVKRESYIAWVKEKDEKSDIIKDKLYYTGYIGEQSTEEKFEEHPDLENITNNEKIIDIINCCILTDKYIYLIIDKEEEMNWEIINNDLFRKPLPTGINFIGVACSANLVYAWTTEGQVYACGRNSDNQISNDTIFRHFDFILMNIPSNLKCIQVVVMNNSAVFLMKDSSIESSDNMFVYASGLNKNGHCLLPENIEKSYFLKVSDIPMKSISGDYTCITAISTNNNLYYAGRLDSGDDYERTKIYGFKLVNYFVNRSLEVDKVFTYRNFCFAKVINKLEDNKIEYYMIGYTSMIPKKYLKDLRSNYSKWDSPNRVHLFSNETKHENSELSDNESESEENENEEESESDIEQESSNSEIIVDVPEENNNIEHDESHSINEEEENKSESSSSESSKSQKKRKFDQAQDNINITSICSYEEYIYFVGELYTPPFTDFIKVTEKFVNVSKDKNKNEGNIYNIKNEKILLTIINSDKFIHEDEEIIKLDYDIKSNNTESENFFNKIIFVEIKLIEDKQKIITSRFKDITIRILLI